VENASEGVTLQLDKNAQTAGPLNCYVYRLMDAQLNIGDGRLISSVFYSAHEMLLTMQPLPLPCEPHSAIICGQTGCGKAFEVVFILCPTWKRNHTYLERLWLWRGPHASRVLFIDPRERLHDWLRALFSVAADTPTLYLINDMAASRALTKKKDMLSELAFSGRHAKQWLWVLVQNYNAVCKDLREQTKWVALFHCKDRFSFTHSHGSARVF